MKLLLCMLLLGCAVLALIPSADDRERIRFYERVMNGETHQEGDQDWYV